MPLKHVLAGLAVCLFLPAAPAFSHAGFLVPVLDESDTTGDVILNASFSDSFPEMEIALRSETWTIVTPSGEQIAFDKIGATSARTVLKTRLTEEGAYRLTSGERLGRTGEMARTADGAFVRLGQDGADKASLPEGTEILSSQTATVSDIYLARGLASENVLASRIGRLAIVPESDPTGLSSGGRLTVKLLFEGAPLAGKDVTVFSPGSAREEGSPETTRTTDAGGRLELAFDAAGAYLVMVRHIALAPDEAETDVRSYTSTLTLICE